MIHRENKQEDSNTEDAISLLGGPPRPHLRRLVSRQLERGWKGFVRSNDFRQSGFCTSAHVIPLSHGADIPSLPPRGIQNQIQTDRSHARAE